uniref:Subtilase family protein n=1 Tax=Candidatus Kentrum sp. LPFa TaxID=2126335 RepID=A0A450WBR1_9GAMM|nr:MAG: Subtilase family protein [Candidatus Kentron sp. LPFa]
MSNEVDVAIAPETTGRFIVTFRENAHTEAMSLMKKRSGLAKAKLMSSADFGESGILMDEVPEEGGVVFENLGMAVVSMEDAAVGMLAQEVGDDSSILAIEPEGIMYVIGTKGLSLEYLRGFRDAANTLYTQADQGLSPEELAEVAVSYKDTPSLTWGLQATNAATSKYSGRGIKVAVLDTGLDLNHPDFSGRSIVSKSFISGLSTAQDGHGHGTHCTGTACGSRQSGQHRRHGVAYEAQIFIGKVLSDGGSGGDIGILGGIEWAVANRCDVISMSLGSPVCSTSIAYETAGQRALNAGSLIVAAAGNDARRPGYWACVCRPANSKTFMAVAALDSKLTIADFSSRDTARNPGTAVDIAAPGVDVYSAWPMPMRTRVISGTSMATPHVAGIAALWAQATQDRGAALWQRLITNARTLSARVDDVGRGLVQAP